MSSLPHPFINNSYYRIEEYPKFNPVLDEYERVAWFALHKRRCIEGYWVSGQWMPGPLYYYINFHHILIESVRGSQEKGLPQLRDNDWKLFRLYEEARGFSGFADDPVYTCNRKLGPDRAFIEELGLIETYIEKGLIRREDLSKTYMNTRDYLEKVHLHNLGKPLYHNSAKFLISMQGRGGGKSYGASGMCAHNWLFSGAMDYDYYLEKKQSGEPLSSDTIIGAIDSKYSDPLHSKTLFGVENLPGTVKYDNGIYPSPLFKGFHGSRAVNEELTIDSDNSVLYHRTFRNNPLAGNAGRPNLITLDEIGFFTQLVETVEALDGSQASKLHKNLVLLMLGTGGLATGASVLHAEKVFRDPAQYNCLEFDDEWEQTGKIGHFVSILHTRALHKKGPNLVTDEQSALKEEEAIRKKKKGDKLSYQGHIVNNPIKPSEVFLVVEGGLFPTLLLKDQLAELLGGKLTYLVDSSYKGWIKFNERGEPIFETAQDGMPIRNFPLDKYDEKKGLVELFVKPVRNENGEVVKNRYIAGIDVVDKATGKSLPSIHILDMLTNRLVATYTGRTEEPKFFYEVCRRMLLYYGAVGMYENNLIGLYNYFEQEKCLYLLAETPYQLRQAEYKPGTSTSKGIHNTGNINSVGIDFINSWLITKTGVNSDSIMLSTIQCPALLKELIRYNPEGNFDRVSSLIMLFWYYETINKAKKEFREEKRTFLNSDYFVQRGIVKSQEPKFYPQNDTSTASAEAIQN